MHEPRIDGMPGRRRAAVDGQETVEERPGPFDIKILNFF
jgi:hypothetical protein